MISLMVLYHLSYLSKYFGTQVSNITNRLANDTYNVHDDSKIISKTFIYNNYDET